MSLRKIDIHLRTVPRQSRHLQNCHLNNAIKVRSDLAVSKSSWSSWSIWNTWSENETNREEQHAGPKRIYFNTISSDSWVNIYLRYYWKRFKLVSNCYTQCVCVYTLCMQIASSSNINVVHRYDGTTLFNNSTPTHNSSFPSFLPSSLTRRRRALERERESEAASTLFERKRVR